MRRGRKPEAAGIKSAASKARDARTVRVSPCTASAVRPKAREPAGITSDDGHAVHLLAYNRLKRKYTRATVKRISGATSARPAVPPGPP